MQWRSNPGFVLCLCLAFLAPTGAAAGAGETAAPDSLRLEDALGRALLESPALAAQDQARVAARALARQAAAFPNPEFEVELEELDRDGAGFDSAELALGLALTLETGGKRGLRRAAALEASELSAHDYETARLELLSQTRVRFYELLAAQHWTALADSTAALAAGSARVVQERVRAGKEPPFQALKAAAELDLARLTAQEAKNAEAAARLRLAAQWQSLEAPFPSALGELDKIPAELPSLARLQEQLERNPQLARAGRRCRLGRVLLDTERAGRIPDLTLSVGYRHFREDDTSGLSLGFSAPLPLFDRNSAGISAARSQLASAEAERSALRSSLAAELAAAHATLVDAHARARTLMSSTVPAMEQAFEAARDGYRQGKFGYMDVLDAQRSLFAAEQALNEALTAYHRAAAETGRLTGSFFDSQERIDEEDGR